MSAPNVNEHVIMTEIRAALARRPDMLVWRNNTGRFWTIPKTASCAACGSNLLSGQGIKGAYQTVCGLGLGSADLVGVQLVDGVGRFVGIEVKTDRGRTSDDQDRWLAAAARHGALAGVARSVDEAMGLVDG